MICCTAGPIGGPFTLVDQTSKLRSDCEFRGELMIIYFGYTHCPDVCPADLQAIALALDQLTSAANEQPIFITMRQQRAGGIRLRLSLQSDENFHWCKRCNPTVTLSQRRIIHSRG